MRTEKWMFAGLVTLASMAPSWAADGLRPDPDNLPWERWQGRVSLGSSIAPARDGWADSDAPGRSLASFSLMGDYYFARSPIAGNDAGGFRATSGIIVGPRGPLGAAEPTLAAGSAFSVGRPLFGPGAAAVADGPAIDVTTTLPYVGVGYTGLSARSGWSFSADLGLVARGLGSAVKLGRSYSPAPSLDDPAHDVHMSPVVQFGASYAF